MKPQKNKSRFSGSPRGRRNWFEWCRANLKALGMGASAFAYGAAQGAQGILPDLKGISPWWIVAAIAVIGGGIVSAHELHREKHTDNTPQETNQTNGGS